MRLTHLIAGLLLLLAGLTSAQETDDPDVLYPEEAAVEAESSDDATPPAAEDPTGWLPAIELAGYIQADIRHSTEPTYAHTWNENRLGLRLTTKWDQAEASGELRLRGTGFTTSSTADDLADGDALQPWTVELRSAYLTLYGLPFAPVDITLGRTEVGWGVGDELRTFNVVNPGDYEDPLRFGERLPVNLLRVTGWFSSTWSLEGVVVPGFTPAKLPSSRWMPETELELGEYMGMELWTSELTTPIELPDQAFSQSAQYGARLKGGLGFLDIELAWDYGRDELPVPTAVDVELTADPDAPFGTIPVNVTATSTFPRRHVFGASFAADIADIGFMGECAAYWYPEDVIRTVNSPLGSTESVLYPAKPYFKWMGSMDYSVEGWTMTLIYNHGFYSERGAAELHDYFILAVEKSFFYDKLKLRLAGSLEVPDFETFEDNWGFALLPEVTYAPLDGIGITLGGYWLEGDGASNFAQLEHNDEVYLKLQVDL